MTNDAVVSVVNTLVYGKSKKYKIEDTSEASLVQWAVETKQLLLAHPDLAKVKLILKDSISPEAKESLWSCSAKLAAVQKGYPAGNMSVQTRQTFHLEWLDSIIDACAPSSTALVLEEMRKVKWSEGSTSKDTWSCQDIMVYFARLKEIEARMGGAMELVSEKAKLDVVEHKIPSGLKLLAKATLQRHTGDGPAPQDTWEKALMRVAREIKKQEECAALPESIRVKQKHDTPKPYRPTERPHVRLDDTFKKKKKWRERGGSGDAERRGKGKGSGKTSGRGKGKSSGRGGDDDKDLSHIECFNCGEKGHYSNKCPHAKRDAPRGGGKGKGKGSGKGRGGGKGAPKDAAKDERA